MQNDHAGDFPDDGPGKNGDEQEVLVNKDITASISDQSINSFYI